jgi:AraC family transcriptional regulator, transcriptional activator of pobA
MKYIKFQRPDNRNLNFEIIKVKPQNINRNTTPDRHRHEFYSIFFVLDGTSTQEIDFEKYNITRRQIVFIPKGAIHWEIESRNLECYIMLFKDDFLAKPMMNMINSFVKYVIFQRKLILNLSEAEHQEFLKLAEVIEQEHAKENHQNLIFILQNLLLVWINKMESVTQNLALPNNFINGQLLAQKFITLLNENYIGHKEISFYCDRLQCTPKKLSQTLNSIFGLSTNDFIIESIMLEAKRKLCYTNFTVKEIAFKLGYENPHYFSRIFKTKTGLSPEEFRNEFGA